MNCDYGIVVRYNFSTVIVLFDTDHNDVTYGAYQEGLRFNYNGRYRYPTAEQIRKHVESCDMDIASFNIYRDALRELEKESEW